MATILAHLQVHPSKEAEWEAIMADMVRQTFEQSALPPTENPPLPDDASETLRNTEQVFPISIPGWWAGRA